MQQEKVNFINLDKYGLLEFGVEISFWHDEMNNACSASSFRVQWIYFPRKIYRSHKMCIFFNAVFQKKIFGKKGKDSAEIFSVQ